LLTVEVEWDAPRLMDWLNERGLETRGEGRTLAVTLNGEDNDAIYQAVVEGVATLDLSLVRLSQQRHTLEDLFRPHELEHEEEPVAP
jgi:hypothetical protein